MECDDFSPFGFSRVLKGMLAIGVEQGVAVASWRLPDGEDVEVLVDLSYSPDKKNLQMQPHLSGFVIGPFMNTGGLCHLLKPDIRLVWQQKRWTITSDFGEEAAVFFRRLRGWLTVKNNQSPTGWQVSPAPERLIETGKKKYKQGVSQGLTQIEQGHLEKVVLSRQKRVSLQAGSHPVDVYKTRLKRNRSGMISLLSVPDLGTWCGASPELLISRDGQGICRTMALAGTRRSALQPWSQKEWNEQEVVAGYIRDCLDRLRLTNIQESKPETVTAYDMVHIQTRFQVDGSDNPHDELPFRLLKQLHPTPAVCGVERQAALDFILAQEASSRQLYAGYLGPIQEDGAVDLYVNLRCMQFRKKSAVLYAGAGVVRGSVPSDEWRETEMKMETMVEILAK
ncbi:MAG: chorismate-binding protein [Magnetococcales bacterium]|nr:chorismate-binding protein [Magnetococcales bacterium]